MADGGITNGLIALVSNAYGAGDRVRIRVLVGSALAATSAFVFLFLAAVLIATGLLVVYSGRFMTQLHGDGPLLRRWLPLASAAAVTALGFAIALRALLSAGFLQMRM